MSRPAAPGLSPPAPDATAQSSSSPTVAGGAAGPPAPGPGAGPPAPGAPGAAARRTGAVLVVTAGRGPPTPPPRAARGAGHRGLGANGGRITGLDLEVEARPRGQRPRRATVAITGQSGDVTWATTQIDPTPLKIAQ